jgi:dienelactone hydrolase
MMRSIRLVAMLAAIALGASCATGPQAALTTPAVIIGADSLRRGEEPAIHVSGLAPHEQATIFSVRTFTVWRPENGVWGPAPRSVIAWADVKADSRGAFALAQFEVERGTWRGKDAFGLFWSGRRSDDPLAKLPPGLTLNAARDGEGEIVLVRASGAFTRTAFNFGAPQNVTVTEVDEGPLNGVFAAPAAASKRPTIIILHGSEGGGRTSARIAAESFAAQGFAALAVNYFAWDFQNLPAIPNVHVNQPIELLEDAYAWLSGRPEVDAAQLGVWGVSKGAEFAAVAAVRLGWIRAVVACVPTDVVWEGYGIGDDRAKRNAARWTVPPMQMSSWSWRGQPLAYVRLRPFKAETFFDNTARYEASRADADAPLLEAATIKIEESKARFLLLGGGRDEVWASGKMAAALQARMQAAGRASDARAVVFQQAGHGICGDPATPVRLFAEDDPDPRRKSPDAEGRAAVEAWRLTRDFFQSTLQR